MKQKLFGANPNTPQLVLFSIFFLFFFQLITDFVEAIYAFGLLGTGIPPEIVCVVFLFSPILLFFFKSRIPKGFVLLSGGLLLAARVAEVSLDTRGKMIVSGIGVAAFLVFLPVWLLNSKQEMKQQVNIIAVGLLGGLSISILLTSLNSSVDISTHGAWLIGLAFALLGAYLLWQTAPSVEEAAAETNLAKKSSVKTMVFSLGIFSILALLYLAFTSPNVIARWTGVDYLVVLAFAWAGILLTGWLWFNRPEVAQTGKTLLVWNLVFVFSLILTILPHQISFPDSPESYPFPQPVVSQVQLLPLFIMLLTFPVLFLDFERLQNALLHNKPSIPNIAAGFLAGGFFLMLVIFSHVFTTVYDYIPVVGPFFRNKFWLAYLLPGIILIGSIGLSEKGGAASAVKQQPNHWFTGLAGLAALSIIGVNLISANPILPQTFPQRLRILTYNIQQGYDQTGLWNFDGQLELIRSLDPDIIGLQESDTNRIAGGNKDVVGYFADHLDMYAYYGPGPISGTFGIALLSKYPIEQANAYYLYSAGEQVAVIEAEITIGGDTFTIFVNHLGNGGPLIQQQQFLEIAAGKQNVIAMGDYNFRPDTEQYDLTIQSLDDAYRTTTSPPTVDGFNPETRIDHIFLSSEFQVREVVFLPAPHSDHPALLILLEW